MRFTDRTHAGRLLAVRLSGMGLHRPVILALPRGGVPVGLEVARVLHAPLDLVLVRKIGAPWEKELAAAALAEGAPDDIVFNEDVMTLRGLTPDRLDAAVEAERHEIRRRRELYMRGRHPVELTGRDAVLVDDGIATGASLRAAIRSVRHRHPARVIVAAPVAGAEAVEAIRLAADSVVCLATPQGFSAIGAFYDDFHQLSDQEVIDLMQAAPQDGRGAHAPAVGGKVRLASMPIAQKS